MRQESIKSSILNHIEVIEMINAYNILIKYEYLLNFTFDNDLLNITLFLNLKLKHKL